MTRATIASLALLTLACVSPRPPPPTTVRSRAELVSALSELARARGEECGCASAVGPWLEEALRMTYEGAPSLDASATARCLAAAERALGAGCVTVPIPEECDLAAIASVPTPSMFVGKGASCNYAICARGLVCLGEEEAACVPGHSTAGAGSLCARAYDLPPFAP